MRFITSTSLRIVIAICALLLSACTPETQLTSEWKNPEVSGPPLKKIAVFVIAKKEEVRRYAEDQMVEKLPDGVTGVVGYSMFAKPEGKVTEVANYLVKNGFDGVLVTRLVSIDKTKEYVPPRTTVHNTGVPYYGGGGYYGGRAGFYNNFNGYYGHAYNSTYTTTTPGYEKNQTNVVVETMLYRLPSGVLMWSGTTESLNPEKKSELVQSITDIIESKINQSGLLK
jgi:hypothetical protein